MSRHCVCDCTCTQMIQGSLCSNQYQFFLIFPVGIVISEVKMYFLIAEEERNDCHKDGPPQYLQGEQFTVTCGLRAIQRLPVTPRWPHRAIIRLYPLLILPLSPDRRGHLG